MPQYEPHSPKELRAQVKYYFSCVRHYIEIQDAHRAASNATRLAHFGLRLLEHPEIKLEFAKAHAAEEAAAKQKTVEEYEKAIAEADAAVVARLTGPQEE
jgi:hypothetical protein